MNSLAFAAPRTGKTVYSVGHLLEYLHEGRTVVTNFPLDYDAIQNTAGKRIKKARITCISPRPTSTELFALGEGWHPDFPNNEEKCGCMVIDEAGTWIGARTWNDSDREEIKRWFTLSGKLGWDVLLLSQSPDLVDKSIKDSCIELFGRVMRTDRVKVPFLGIKLPRFHVVQFRYGTEGSAPKAFTKAYRGNSVYKYFDTHFKFEDFAPYSFFRPLKKITAQQLRRMHLKTEQKHPLVEMLKNLPEEQRIKHWKRLNEQGAFDKSAEYWKSVFSSAEKKLTDLICVNDSSNHSYLRLAA
jgi:hypothetical protein